MDKEKFKLLLTSAIQSYPSRIKNDLYDVRNVHIDELLTAINAFQDASSKLDIKDIILEYPELGQILSLLGQDVQVLSNRKFYSYLMKSILWFHRPNSRHPLEIKATQWATVLVRNTVIYPMREILTTAPGLQRLGILVPQEQLTELLITTWKNQHHRTSSDACLNLLCKDILVLLSTTIVDPICLFSVIDTLPPASQNWCPADGLAVYKRFSQSLTRGRSSDNINVHLGLHTRLIRKYVVHLEDEVLRLFCQYTSDCQRFPKELQSTWMIKTIIQDRQLFCAAIQIINALMRQMNFHFKTLDFVHKVLDEVRKHSSLVMLYPHHVAALVYFLDIDPEVISDTVETHALDIMKNIESEIHSGSLSAMEAFLLCCHFPKWWHPITALAKKRDVKDQITFLAFWKSLGLT